ncbi:hypothetical protein [Salinicoccus roseus]|uniref:Phage terminase small subunit n=1 Tax=Salinicoccus roseus TaxID=45670 RepID=A0A265E6H7_9STAP|nr:hypothetical protein [Salinicoccus roseus]OZT77120.1 hypothetical protein CFN03_08575 [Salinicoccus roseus]
MAAAKTEKTKEQRIRTEYNRIKKSYKPLPKESMNVVEGLIKRAAFMRISLEDMEEDLMENGSVEMFSQSDNQIPYERERPVARLYNTMNGNYQKIIRELTSHLPKDVKEKLDSPEDIMTQFSKLRGDD